MIVATYVNIKFQFLKFFLQISIGNDSNVEEADQEISQLADTVNLECDNLSQPSIEDVPDFLNASYETLKRYAGLGDQDKFIFPE